MPPMRKIPLVGKEFIALCDLLKIAGLCESGGAAKHEIADGYVKVDGVVELRKRCKIRKNQLVEYEGNEIMLVSETDSQS